MKKLLFILIGLLGFIPSVYGASLTYELKAQKVGDGVYVFIGSTEHFNRKNGGDIVNTGFIIGDHSVIVIDSGPSLKYGQAMIKAIRKITPKPVSHVIITHHHPDHFLGNQAFGNVPIMALEETIKAITFEGEGLLENMYHMVGDWMIGTEVINANKAITTSKLMLAGRSLQFIPLHGHTTGDLAIIDEKTQTLFAGDLAFHQRTATTPHAVLDDWILALDDLMAYSFKTVVPGHGPVERDGRSIKQTKDYLIWLKQTLYQAANDGLEMTEIMRLEKPERFQSLSLASVEFQRSVAHLWPAIVEQTLPRLD